MGEKKYNYDGKNMIWTDCFECKYLSHIAPDQYWCENFKCEIPDFYCLEQEKSFNCCGFEQHKSCDNCKYSRCIVYESGTLDNIDYLCKLQDKVMYIDSNCYVAHNYDKYVCAINKWEGIKL